MENSQKRMQEPDDLKRLLGAVFVSMDHLRDAIDLAEEIGATELRGDLHTLLLATAKTLDSICDGKYPRLLDLY